MVIPSNPTEHSLSKTATKGEREGFRAQAEIVNGFIRGSADMRGIPLQMQIL